MTVWSVCFTLKRNASAQSELRMRHGRALCWFDEPGMCLTIHYIASPSATGAPSAAPAHFWGFGTERWEGSPLRSEAKEGGGISETATGGTRRRRRRSATQPHIQHQGIKESVRTETISPKRTPSFWNLFSESPRWGQCERPASGVIFNGFEVGRLRVALRGPMPRSARLFSFR